MIRNFSPARSVPNGIGFLTDFPHPLPKIFNFTYNMHDTLAD